MKRIEKLPRDNWQATVASQGLVYHTGPDGQAYWNEAAYYRFKSGEVDVLEAATIELQACCMAVAENVIENDRLTEIGIPIEAQDRIRWSWDADQRGIYGRFDLVYDGGGPPKMLEYNADTPTTLVEGAVAQYYWMEDCFPHADQFNSIWEGLVEAWKSMRVERVLQGDTLYFASGDNPEDWMTIRMLRDTAEEAGVRTAEIFMEAIGWDTGQRLFVDADNRVIRSIFKLYPWEWLLKDAFGAHALETYPQTRWIEPIWKLVLSCKGILPVLWEMFPGHPNLLPCYADSPRDMASYVAKPIFAREGANITAHTPEGEIQTPGRYAEYPSVYQELCPLPNFDGNHPVIGSWVINGEPHGIGIRESDGLITDNLSRFVPHIFE